MISTKALARHLVLAAVVLVCMAITPAASAQTQGVCGPMDVTFVVDNTGSMALVNEEIQTQINKIADAVVVASGGDYQFGLVALPRNDVSVLLDMAPNNRSDLANATTGLVNESSCGTPASWDEGLNTAVNNLGPRTGNAGAQIGSFAGVWRATATKIIIVITDTDPSGFDCDFELGVHDVTAHNAAVSAADKDILVSAVYVPTGGGSVPEDDVKARLADLAVTTGGLFKESAPDASDLSDIIVDVIAACGGAGGGFFSNLRLDPSEIALQTGDSADVKLTNYAPGDHATLQYTAAGLPTGATVTYSPQTAEIEGTDQQQMHIQIGPETPPGTYFVYAEARHTDNEHVDSNYVLVSVDCKPPALLGTEQLAPQTVAAGSSATFKVNPIGSGRFHYQWYEGYRGMTRNPVAGATEREFKTPAVHGPTPYWVRITNVCGSYDSLTTMALPQP